uniref:LIM interaction domain-containing protein n=1 Tax=Strongyloides papillosus TaxID=174720 RepID=A0A0N5CIZ7_STREA
LFSFALVQKKTRKRNRKNVLAEIGETASTGSPESLNKKKCSIDDSSAENSPINNNLIITATSSDSKKKQAYSNGFEVSQEPKTMEENFNSENERKMFRIEHSPANINESSQQQQQITPMKTINLIQLIVLSDSKKKQAYSNGFEVSQEPKTMEENFNSENERKMFRIEHSPANINESSQQQQQVSNKPLMQQNFYSMINQIII